MFENNKDFLDYTNDKARFYCKNLWGIEFDGKLLVNNRLRRTFAWYLPNENSIEFNKELLTLKDEYKLFLDEVLIHELCHWYCDKNNFDYSDGDFEFEKEIYMCGSRSTEMNSLDNGEVELEDSNAWFYCKECDKTEYAVKINSSERINHYGKRIMEARPKCIHCGKNLSYNCEVELGDNWVKWYPRKRLLELDNIYSILMYNLCIKINK